MEQVGWCVLSVVVRTMRVGAPVQVKWFDAGKFEYFAPASSLFMVQMILFAWVEMRRYQVRSHIRTRTHTHAHIHAHTHESTKSA